MPTKSRSRSFERPASSLIFDKKQKGLEVTFTVSPQPFNFERCCIIELSQRRKPLRFVIDYSVLFCLSITKFGFEKDHEHQGISKVIGLFRQQQFECHFKYRDGCLLITALNLLLHPQKTVPNDNKIFDKAPIAADKGQQPVNQSQSLAFLAFKIIFFLVDYRPKDKQVSTAEERRTANMSIREQIINLILGTQVQSQISHIAKLKLVGLFSFQLLETEYHFQLPAYFNQQRFYAGIVFDNKSVFNPTTITVKIFNQLIRTPQRERLLTGTAGIGKSFSLSLLITLTNYISSYKMESQSKYCRFLGKKQQQQFESIQKFYYVSIGTNSSEDSFINIMRCQSSDQLFLDNSKENLKLDKFLSILDDSYKKQKRKPVIVLDQINFYFSVLRKYKLHYHETKSEKLRQQQEDILYWTYKFHQQILFNFSFSVCYSSSANCELQTNFTNARFSVIRIPQSHSSIVDFERKDNTDRFVELINMVYFQLEKQLTQKKARQCFKLRRKQLDTLLRCDFTKYQANTFPSQLTHHRISLCFCNNLQLREMKLFEEGYSDDMQVIESFESGILETIKAKCQEIFLLDYNKFLQKGSLDLKNKKLKILADLKELCQHQRTEQNIITYQIDPREVESFQESFNKENATISRGGQLTIYYPPKVYLKVIDKLLKNLGQFSPIFQQFIKQFGSNNGLFGSLLGNSITKVLCSEAAKLKINNISFPIAHLQKKLTFEHFFEPQKTQYIIATKLNDVFAALETVSPGIWVAAEPKVKKQKVPIKKRKKAVTLKRQEGDKSKRQEADNYKRIDSIICRRENNKYEIKSFDYAMSRKITSISDKQNKSAEFLTEFVGYARSQNINLLSYEHLILVRQENAPNVRSEILQPAQHKKPQIKLTTISIKRFGIELLPCKEDRSKMLQSLFRVALKAACK